MILLNPYTGYAVTVPDFMTYGPGPRCRTLGEHYRAASVMKQISMIGHALWNQARRGVGLDEKPWAPDLNLPMDRMVKGYMEQRLC